MHKQCQNSKRISLWTQKRQLKMVLALNFTCTTDIHQTVRKHTFPAQKLKINWLFLHNCIMLFFVLCYLVSLICVKIKSISQWRNSNFNWVIVILKNITFILKSAESFKNIQDWSRSIQNRGPTFAKLNELESLFGT